MAWQEQQAHRFFCQDFTGVPGPEAQEHLGEFSEVKALDWGVAKVARHTTQPKTVET